MVVYIARYIIDLYNVPISGYLYYMQYTYILCVYCLAFFSGGYIIMYIIVYEFKDRRQKKINIYM